MPRLKINLLILAGYLCVGCGTLDGIHQRVEIDSTPRGARVYDGDEEELIGRSPMFYDLRRSSGDSFKFQYGETSETLEYECKFRWLVEGVGNGALVFLNPLFAVGAIAIDMVTGGAYDCPESFHLKPEKLHDYQDATYCRRYLVVPPQDVEQKSSEKISLQWMEKATIKFRACDDFVAFSNIRYLKYLNLHRGEKKVTELDNKKLKFLAFESKATHLAVLEVKQVGSSAQVTSTSFDLHNYETEPMEQFAATIPDTKINKPENLLGPIPVSLDLYPNAIANGFSDSNFGAESKDSSTVRGATRSLAASAIGRIAFLSVSHPFGFKEWDYVYGVSSTVNFFTEAIDVKESDDSDFERVRLIQFQPMYYFNITAHTPGGAISYDIGGGLYLGSIDREDASLKGEAGLITSTKISYTAFFSDSLFAQVYAGLYGVRWRSHNPDDYQLRDTYGSVAVMAGYYFTDWR